MFFASGFQNSVSGQTPIKYYLGFMIQDAAGIYTRPSPNPVSSPLFPPTIGTPANQACTGFGPIYTSNVYGFLPSNTKCFVATAAFQSADAEPVRMLREFRDRVLLSFRPGQAFVSWYYSWSPGAADWLEEHPLIRVPVLLGLFELEMVAWFCLHPFAFIC
jgi:hypothetical protein